MYSVKCTVYSRFFIINKHTLLVCQFVSKKLQTGQTDRAQFFCGTSHDHREGLWMPKITKICVKKFVFLLNFEKALQILFLLLFYNEKMLTDKATIKSLNIRWAQSALQA